MLDIDIGQMFSKTPLWWIITVLIGFIFNPIFFIAGIVFILKKSFNQTTIIASSLIVALVTGIMQMGLYFPDNFLPIFFLWFTLSTNLVITSFLGEIVTLISQVYFYLFLVISILVHFVITFGFVRTIQSVKTKINRLSKVS